MDIDQALEQYQTSLEAICEYFDCGLDSPQLMLEEPWFLAGGGTEIRFAYGDEEIDPEDDDAYQYSYEIYGTSLWAKDKYTAARVNDGCGNRFCVVFANKNQSIEED